ncbi:MAG: helix-turn-helix domain-containing protein [Lachnospiraceae bacterium]|nr:helix-turn-helix domain-containing protein [Lachnospiraceae bacterium]
MDRTSRTYQEKASHAWSSDSIRLYGIPGNAVKNDLFYMQEAGYFRTEWPYFTERVGLNSFLVVYTLSGEGVLTYEEKEYRLRPGSCFFIHCMNYHEYHTEKGKQWEFLWLHLNGAGALGYYQQFVQEGFYIIEETAPRIREISSQVGVSSLQMGEIGSPVGTVSSQMGETGLKVGTIGTQIEKQLWEILAANQPRSATTEVCTMRSIVNILTELVLHRSARKQSSSAVPEFIRTAQRYMEKHFAQKINLENLAASLHVSKFYLVKEFGRWIGISPYEYLIEVRMSCAKEMLKYSQEPVAAVGAACGMNQPSHFIRLFREREGKTPLQYRKEWKGDAEGKQAADDVVE